MTANTSPFESISLSPSEEARIDLPEGVRDLAPSTAERQYSMERHLLKVFRSHGYRLLRTPLIERLETLQVGLQSHQLPQVFHLVDPQTGVPLVLRPDLTPQVARSLAQRGTEPGPTRIAVSGPLYRVDRGNDLAPRERYQSGIELIGWSGIEPDIEIITLALESLDSINFKDSGAPVLAIGDANVLERLLSACRVHDPLIQEKIRFDLSRKAFDDVVRRVAEVDGDVSLARRITHLTGPLETALTWSDEDWPGSVQDELRDFTDRLIPLANYTGDTKIIVDLTEVRDRSYYTGVVFEAFVQGAGRPILAGGRYDTLLPSFGLESSAAGFAIDLDALIEVGLSDHARPVLHIVGDRGASLELADFLRQNGYDAARWPTAAGTPKPPWIEAKSQKISWTITTTNDETTGSGDRETLLKELNSWSRSS